VQQRAIIEYLEQAKECMSTEEIATTVDRILELAFAGTEMDELLEMLSNKAQGKLFV
jgi:hypothetical protein